ncbi:MAG: lipoate--protein ligase [Proteocatella sp.]
MRLHWSLESGLCTTMNRVIVSKETDPCYNLALEEELLKSVKKGDIILYLWQNHKTVVIGRNQNPFLECDLEKMAAEGVKLVRRISGGGTVYHDMGNLNFTFVSNVKDRNMQKQLKVIKGAVEKFGINAEFSGRNDLLCEGRKFSGHAFYEEDGNCFHHGTLMVDVDKQILGDILKPSKLKLEAKGITSVKSRVVNLKEFCDNINIERLVEALAGSFELEYGDFEELLEYSAENFTPLEISRHRDDKWVYGQSPHYDAVLEKKTDAGNFQMLIAVENGIVKNARVYSDSLKNLDYSYLEEKLTGIYFHEAESCLESLITYGKLECDL